MSIMPAIISIVCAYFIAAIPTAYIFGRWLKGIDIREHGSGNVGATNAFRVLGKGPGIAVLIIDILKGTIPTALITGLLDVHDPLVLVLVGLTAVAGHNWTVFLNFKGGKGIATSLGVLIGLAIQIPGIRPVLALVLLTWIVVFCIFAYVSVASIVAATMLPILMVVFKAPFVMIVMSIVLSTFIVIRHRSNIKRLIKGQENRVKLPFHRK